jgi:hypothetical protein
MTAVHVKKSHASTRIGRFNYVSTFKKHGYAPHVADGGDTHAAQILHGDCVTGVD